MIECFHLIKEFGAPPQRIIHDLNFSIADAEFVSISGRSGSGKSTLLYIISTLDSATRGQVIIDGKDTAKLSIDEVHKFRNEKVGFVFQFHYLLPELTALENVLLPLRNLGLDKIRRSDAIQLLEELEVADQQNKLPSQMSGGQQQRVASARALVQKPKYLFADEPTGNLDSKNANKVMSIFKRVHKEFGTTVALVTHEPSFAAEAQREIYLIDGKIAHRDDDAT